MTMNIEQKKIYQRMLQLIGLEPQPSEHGERVYSDIEIAMGLSEALFAANEMRLKLNEITEAMESDRVIGCAQDFTSACDNLDILKF